MVQLISSSPGGGMKRLMEVSRKLLLKAGASPGQGTQNINQIIKLFQ